MIEVFWQRLSFSNQVERDQAEHSISESEKARVARLVTPTLREQALASFWGRRLMLSRFLKTEPSSIKFEHGPQGLPTISGSWDRRPVFNLSHSGDWSALAFCWSDQPNFQLGIDLEQMDRQADRELLAPRYFHPREVQALEPSRFGATQFFQIWTAKEAYLKSLGVGLQKALDSFCVVPENRLLPKNLITATIVEELSHPSSQVYQLQLLQTSLSQNLIAHLCYPGPQPMEVKDQGLLET